ncbi:TPA: Tn3 family transposase, partial [Vibrio vulnificus]|nr:Tn3 family transposase [Vibrio vulnificus]
HAILNKGESRHALARAIFLHQLGELRNRAAETMAYRASGLNLVVNAVVLWNTVYLSRAVDYIRSQGILIPEELLSSVAPLPWGHISLTGDYLWNEIDRPLERYRPVRTKRFNPKNFTFP